MKLIKNGEKQVEVFLFFLFLAIWEKEKMPPVEKFFERSKYMASSKGSASKLLLPSIYPPHVQKSQKPAGKHIGQGYRLQCGPPLVQMSAPHDLNLFDTSPSLQLFKIKKNYTYKYTYIYIFFRCWKLQSILVKDTLLKVITLIIEEIIGF